MGLRRALPGRGRDGTTPRAAAVSLVATLLAATGTVALAAGVASAHSGSLGDGARQSLTVPPWLFLTTGGAAVGASFVLASFVTDRSLIGAVHGWRRELSPAGEGARGRATGVGGRVLRIGARLLGLAGLVTVLVTGFAGPFEPLANLAVLLVWVGWWAGLVTSAYLVGNVWPAIDPFRTVAAVLPSLDLDYPERLGAWPAVVGLLFLIWLEVVSPLADDPRLLATVVAGYGVVTLAGSVLVGATWFERVDPVARVFRYYGWVAPVTREDGRLRLRVPGTGLSDPGRLEEPGSVAFVVALVWVTTYDGLVATPTWRGLLAPLVAVGAPPALLYPAGLVLGFLLFLAVYRLAGRASRSIAETYVAVDGLARRFAPPLLAIAAGYHLAHYLGYFLTLAPAIGSALSAPIAGVAEVAVLSLPGWIGAVPIAAVLAGHLLAIWVAHAAAYDLFPGRLQAVRSQYPYTAVMVLYTMISLWIVSRPEIALPYL